jgi:hypothetical protein
MAIDPYTGNRFTPKRSNQKFESSANRIAYNNKKAKDFRELTKSDIKPLIQNFKILLKLKEEKPDELFHYEFLKGLGFSFKHFSSLEKKGDYAIAKILNLALIQSEGKLFKIE